MSTLIHDAGSVAETGAARGPFLRSRLGSILGLMPLGVWTVVHVWNNLAAFQGSAAWQSAVTGYSHPIAHAATLVMVLLPLLLHTIWGLQRLATSRPNNLRYRFFGNARYALQRLSAIGVLLFIGAHLWLAMLQPRLVRGHAETFADISGQMHDHMPTLVVYILGTLGVAYHLANGVHGIAMGWGLVATRRGLRRVERGAIAFGLLLLAMSWAAIYALWRAGGA